MLADWRSLPADDGRLLAVPRNTRSTLKSFTYFIDLLTFAVSKNYFSFHFSRIFFCRDITSVEVTRYMQVSLRILC